MVNMKILVKSFGMPTNVDGWKAAEFGCEFEMTLETNANIRQLRDKLANCNGLPPECWDEVEILYIKDAQGRQLGNIYSDDPSDETLLDHFRREASDPTLVVNNIIIFMRINLVGGHYRPTQLNPTGKSVDAGLAKDPQNKFLKEAADQVQEKSYKQRLMDIKFDMESIPEKFLDQISMEIMNDPIITSNQRVFDRSTIVRLNYIDPNSRQRISISRPNLQLRAEIEQFVRDAEDLHRRTEERNRRNVERKNVADTNAANAVNGVSQLQPNNGSSTVNGLSSSAGNGSQPNAANGVIFSGSPSASNVSHSNNQQTSAGVSSTNVDAVNMDLPDAAPAPVQRRNSRP